MKRLRSYGDDLASAGEKEIDRNHHRRFYSKAPENGRRRPSPAIDGDRNREGSSRGVNLRKRGDHDFGDNSFDDRDGGIRSVMRERLDHDLEGFDDREGSRGLRKRGDHDFSDGFDNREGSKGFRKRFEHENEGFDRRKGFDRYRDRDGCVSSSLVSPRGGYVVERERERERERDRERIHRSESFCMSRRDFPKGFRSERHWSRREDTGLSSWRRLEGRNKKDIDDDAKSSPVERGGSCSSKGGPDGGGASSSRESLRSPQGIKDVKSPTWSKDSTKDSKDSVGESLKDSKKNDSMVVESAGSGGGRGSRSGSEMEEGELHPDALQVPTQEHRSSSKQDVENVAGHAKKTQIDPDTSATGRKLIKEDEKEANKQVIGDVTNNVVVEKTENLSTCQSDSLKKASICEEVKVSAHKDSEVAAANDECSRQTHPECSTQSSFKLDQISIDRSSTEKESLKNNFDLEVGLEASNKGILKEVEKEVEPCVSAAKDKGKGLAICSPDEISFRETNLLIERNFIACQDDCMEGPSTRGFELFSSSAGIKMESANRTNISKAETKKLKLEPLDLSLGLPHVSVPVASNSVAAAPPSSPSRARSVQSFGTTLRTGSDCFTTSISFSGSQFVHNPSCSLTHNSVDYDFEQSVKSRPLFQGVDWQALSANDPMPKEILAKQKSVSNANGSLQLSHAPQGLVNGRAVQGQQGMPSGMDRSTSFQSKGSHDTRSEYGKDKKQGFSGERDLVERIIYLIVSEPIQAMALRVHDLPDRSVVCLKESSHEILVKKENRVKLRALQEVLRKRSDLSLETLLKAHRVQLQILVAIKMGLPDFLQHADGISSSDLADIFLGLKCRNSNCRSGLPADECDCRFCSQKDGFCNSCMCLVCAKFDTALNTCGWVGCDVCNHWCHTDCGLLKYYIRNGQSASGAQGASEMQFYCLACEHPSEMFGFVKDVFNTCAAEWKAETLHKELEYVKRIFSASNATRGKLLHDVAKQLLVRLQAGANAVEVCNKIVGFLNDSESKFGNTMGSSGRGLQLQPLEKNRRDVGDGVATLGQEPIWSKPISAKELSRVENVRITHPSILDGNSVGGSRSWNTDIMLGMNKSSPVVDELDSIIKIKQAEAQMFQKRADDARREAEGLKRIAVAKSEKIEEEYSSRMAKLCLSEVEETRRLKLEELHVLERSHREYFNMKTRMEAEIKDLLLKMEATRRNLSY